MSCIMCIWPIFLPSVLHVFIWWWEPSLSLFLWCGGCLLMKWVVGGGGCNVAPFLVIFFLLKIVPSYFSSLSYWIIESCAIFCILLFPCGYVVVDKLYNFKDFKCSFKVCPSTPLWTQMLLCAQVVWMQMFVVISLVIFQGIINVSKLLWWVQSCTCL